MSLRPEKKISAAEMMMSPSTETTLTVMMYSFLWLMISCRVPFIAGFGFSSCGSCTSSILVWSTALTAGSV
jgi:hypothetical protein